MAYFSPAKTEGEKASSEHRFAETVTSGKPSSESMSTLGRDMFVTGNIVCAGVVQVMGRVVGDIYAAKLIIGDGANVEGKMTAPEVVIHGIFKGTIQANAVSLQSTAIVEGEVIKQSLTIEPNAQFEGMSRRLEKPVDAPSSEQARGEMQSSGSTAEVVPFSGSIG
jgi:cytoskeletal protein CcmA (bactofilin family)